MERDHGTDTAFFGALLTTRACQGAKGQLLTMGRHTGVKNRSQRQNVAIPDMTIGKFITKGSSMRKNKRIKWKKLDNNAPVLFNRETVIDGEKRKETSASSVRICKDSSGGITVSFPYDPSTIEKIKSVKGYRWHPDRKLWSVPCSDESLEKVLKALAGKNIHLDQTLELEPPFLIDKTRKMIQAGHYSRKSEKSYIGWVRSSHDALCSLA